MISCPAHRLTPYAALLTLVLVPAALRAEPAPPPTTPDQAMSAGAEAARRGHFEQAAGHWRLAADAYARTDDKGRRLDALMRLAEAQQALGNVQDALATLESGRSLADATADPLRHAALLGALGKAQSAAGAPDQARASLTDSIAQARQAAAPAIAAAAYQQDRKSTRLNSSHNPASRMPSSA
jgi:tetratricopeptide (TPR) repeat protein